MENLELMNLTPDKINVRTVFTACSWLCGCQIILILLLFTEGSEAEQRHPDQTVQTIFG